MTISVGASVSNTVTTSGTGSAVIGTVTTQASGSTFVMFFDSYAASAFVGSDNKGNTYTLYNSYQVNTPDGIASACYVCQNGTGGSGHAFSVANNTSATIDAYVIEIVGGQTSGITDQFFGSGGGSSPYNAPVTTTSANELILSYLTSNGAATTVTFNGSFTSLLTISNGAVGYRVVSATGTYDPACTQTATGRTNLITASFIQLSGGSAPGPLPRRLFILP